MWDKKNVRQQEALGIVGVNLIYAAFHYSDDPQKFILSLVDGVSSLEMILDVCGMPPLDALLPFPEEKVRPSGNTALLGAKMALFAPADAQLAYPEILARVEHIALNTDEAFQDIYAEEMVFP